jgi:hypothetical protein
MKTLSTFKIPLGTVFTRVKVPLNRPRVVHGRRTAECLTTTRPLQSSYISHTLARRNNFFVHQETRPPRCRALQSRCVQLPGRAERASVLDVATMNCRAVVASMSHRIVGSNAVSTLARSNLSRALSTSANMSAGFRIERDTFGKHYF